MATLCHFSSFPSLSPLKLFHKRQELKLGFYTLRHQNLPHKRFRCRASSIKKSRKVKTNAELCDDIREFVAATGLPEGRLPTMKEFLQHGRSDLAYSVRRRGYKRIGELLRSIKEIDSDGSDVGRSVSEDKYALGDSEDKDDEPNVVVADLPSLIESSSNLVMDSKSNLDNKNHVLVKASEDVSLWEVSLHDLEGHNEIGFTTDGDGFLEPEVSITKHHSHSFEDPTMDSGNQSENPLGTSTNVSLGEEGLNGADEMVNIAIESSDDLLVEGETEEKGLNDGDETVNISIESAEDLLVEGETREKGLEDGDEGLNIDIGSANDFLIQRGSREKGLHDGNETVNIAIESADEGETSQNFEFEDNDVAEEYNSSAEVFIAENDSRSLSIDSAISSDDDSSVPVNLSALSLEERAANFLEYGQLDTVEEAQFVNYMSDSEHSEKVHNGGNGIITSNESAAKSFELVAAATGKCPRDDDSSAEGQSTQFNKNLDFKSSTRENQVEIGHLKFMLHQKELELSRLKEQIEKEKYALSVLQAKAESEISKAQNLISEKDAELSAAEENLSGLVEVHIQYHGDGEMVEVAGSFNGWHHWIKMDPQPSSSITDSVGPRKSKLWSTVLWLYPGVYEIKFIVDGEWKIDPQRESVNRGHICNNILRVDR